jgi:hypothetical protein
MGLTHAAVTTGTPIASRSAPRVLELSAETLGCRVPRTRQEGRVAAVFDRACIVALTGGGMITLLAQNCSNNPHGVRLSCSPRFDQLLSPHMPVQVSRDRIGFDRGRVIVLLGQARTWRAELQPGMFDQQAGGDKIVLSVERLLRARATGIGSDFLAVALGLARPATPLAARVAEVLPRLSRCVQTADAREALQSIGRLIGLGPGLTPAGDDFVVGWLAGAALAARAEMQLDFLQAVCARIGALQSATTPISWQHLDDARSLSFSERLSDLAVAIARRAPEPILTARVEAQLVVGATSGADAAAGLVVALRASIPSLQTFQPS